MTRPARFWLIELVAGAGLFAGYWLLGNAVSHKPPTGIDLAGRALAGEAPRIAAVFTISCFLPVLVAFGVIAALVAIRYPAWRERVIFSIALTLCGWGISDALKAHFARPRPEYWHVFHETSAAYSSGHAMFAIVVYALWGGFFATSCLPIAARRIFPVALAFWALAILWSRLALGAHYVTDVLGGVMLGIALLALGDALRASIRPRSIAG